MLYLWNEWVQLLSESYVRMSRGWQIMETLRKTSSFGMSESSIDLLVRRIVHTPSFVSTHCIDRRIHFREGRTSCS